MMGLIKFDKKKTISLTFIIGSKSLAYRLMGPATTMVSVSSPVLNVHPFILTAQTVGLWPKIPQ